MKKKVIIFTILILLVIAGGVFWWWQSGKKTTEEKGEKSRILEKIKSPISKGEGKIAFVSAGNIHIINPDRTNEARLTKGAQPIWSPNGKRIAYLIEEENIYLINQDGQEKLKVVENIEGTYSRRYFSWSPDSKEIVFVKDGSIWVINTDRSNLIRIIKGNDIISPVFSPDGNKIAYFEKENGQECFRVINRDGSGKTTLAKDYFDRPLTLNWSPNGKKIVYETDDNGGQIYVVDADGTNNFLLDSGFAGPAIFLPDGKKIAYIRSFSGADNRLFVINPDGTNKKEIVKGGTMESLSCSPDGKKIVFDMDEQIYIVNSDGTGLTKIAYGFLPQWSPR